MPEPTELDLTSPDVWKDFAPHLHVGDSALWHSQAPVEPTAEQAQELSRLVKQEGYFQGRADWGLDTSLMAETVRALSAARLSPVFAFIYDEYWLPFLKLHSVVSGLLGGAYAKLPDFWVWNVDPKRQESGWKPHRDKGRRALFPDGTPKSITVWIPLSVATPLNGCMYIVPAMHDPTYATPEEKTWRFELPSVRALPAQPGDFFVWNQAVLHWGGKSASREVETRVSMAFEFQRTDIAPFNAPLIEPLRLPSFDERLKLVAKQILQYRHMYAIDPQVEKLAMRWVEHTG